LAYPGFNNIDGWMSEVELRWLFVTSQKMASIVELGSWQGRSTHALLSGCPGLVYAVDLWNNFNKLNIPDENAFQIFQRNLSSFKNLIILRMSTIEAAKHLKGKVEMVFVDAGHTYVEALTDIQVWLPKTSKMICGHDYHPEQFPGVFKAVNEIFGSVKTIDSIWFKEL
jgi:hypothetical protein